MITILIDHPHYPFTPTPTSMYTPSHPPVPRTHLLTRFAVYVYTRSTQQLLMNVY